MSMDLKMNIFKYPDLPKVIYKFNETLIKISMTFFTERGKNLKTHMKTKYFYITTANLEQLRIRHYFKTYCLDIVTQTQ